jgi:hypothetical protein
VQQDTFSRPELPLVPPFRALVGGLCLLTIRLAIISNVKKDPGHEPVQHSTAESAASVGWLYID